MRPEERNLPSMVSARRMPTVSLPDKGKPKTLMLPVPIQFLIVVMFSFIITIVTLKT